MEQTPEAPAAPKPPESPLRSLTAEGRAEDSAEGNESAPPEPTQAPTANKTDAIADMFDLLQDSKQKREAKLLKSAQRESVSSASTSGNKSDSSSWIKFALSCVGVILLGLVLGQLFQQTTPLKKEVTKEVSKEGVTKSASNSDAQAQATPAIKTEVIDRSNEKMIIRSTVERRMEAAKPEVHPANAGSATPEKKANDREMEELKDLKKELQELKAMKDDLKNNPNNEAMDPNDPDVETLNANEEPLAPREFPRGENGLLTPAN